MPMLVGSGTAELHSDCHCWQAATYSESLSADELCRQLGNRRTISSEAPLTDDRNAGSARSAARRTPRPPLDTGKTAWFQIRSDISTFNTAPLTINIKTVKSMKHPSTGFGFVPSTPESPRPLPGNCSPSSMRLPGLSPRPSASHTSPQCYVMNCTGSPSASESTTSWRRPSTDVCTTLRQPT